MKILKLDYVREAMQGCVNDDYDMICRAGEIILGLTEGSCEIDVEEKFTKTAFKCTLYRKFMRAYTRYIIANPNYIQSLSIDCFFSSKINGEYSGIKEPYKIINFKKI